jgi:peptidoglycan hydrolase CwlO-like protein
MSRSLSTLTVVVILYGVMGLHLLDNTQDQIDALKKQQDNFQTVFGKLVANITQIETLLNNTPNTNDKIIILENAIIS